MAKDPAFLFYSNDFLSGTYLMNNEQVGKYIRLLCLQHQKGSLSKKDMLNICKTYDEDIFSKFAINKDGNYFNIRLNEEFEKRRAYSESRSINRKCKKISKTYVKHMENENENVIKDESINKDIFNEARKLYPGTKRGNETEFKNFIKHKNWKEVLSLLLPSIKNQIRYRENAPSDKFVPEWKNFKTWINNKCWEDIMPVIKSRKQLEDEKYERDKAELKAEIERKKHENS